MTGDIFAAQGSVSSAQENVSAGLSPSVLRSFFHYLIPSVTGLLAISTASVVDGLLVAKFIGPAALSAVNLLIPLLTFFFGVSLMFAIGGSVRAVYFLGEKNTPAAAAVFSNTLLLVFIFAMTVVVIAVVWQTQLLQLLGAPTALWPLLHSYFSVLLFGVPLQLTAVVFYYFLRSLGYPRQATRALLMGAALNIVLDSIFLAVLGWGIEAAAWATVAAQATQLITLFIFWMRLPHGLYWYTNLRYLGATLRATLNGLSEFINEISVGLVIGVMHWLLAKQQGVAALAGFALVNYGLFVYCMVCCAIAEVVYTLVSQASGAGNPQRARAYLRLALVVVGIFGLIYCLLLLSLGPHWISALFTETSSGDFNGDDVGNAAHYARQFLFWVSPAFLLCGFNLVFSAWFTGQQRAGSSSVIALLRSLILPLLVLLVLHLMSLSNPLHLTIPLIVAVPLAEGFTLLAALIMFARSRRDTR